jgi:hypothetical protein
LTALRGERLSLIVFINHTVTVFISAITHSVGICEVISTGAFKSLRCADHGGRERACALIAGLYLWVVILIAHAITVVIIAVAAVITEGCGCARGAHVGVDLPTHAARHACVGAHALTARDRVAHIVLVHAPIAVLVNPITQGVALGGLKGRTVVLNAYSGAACLTLSHARAHATGDGVRGVALIGEAVAVIINPIAVLIIARGAWLTRVKKLAI